MPDVDIVHESVPQKYWNAYKQLCEGLLTPEELSEAITKALRETLKDEGKAPSELIFESLRSAFGAAGIGMPIDVVAAGRMIDQLAGRSLAQSRYVYLAVEAFKAGLTQATNLHDYEVVKKAVSREYVSRLLDADFIERLPPAEHHMNASPEDISARLLAAEPHIDSQLAHIVDQIVRHETVETLQKKPAKQSASPDFSSMDISLPHLDGKDSEKNGR